MGGGSILILPCSVKVERPFRPCFWFCCSLIRFLGRPAHEGGEKKESQELSSQDSSRDSHDDDDEDKPVELLLRQRCSEFVLR